MQYIGPDMFPKPAASIAPNTARFETTPLIKPAGFREYDARWVFGSELNLAGAQALGFGLGSLIHEMGIRPDVVVGHDYRSYSASIKHAMTTGLVAAGCRVQDIGLALSPMAYFAQFDLDAPAVAMVTASHNDNGWTGVKMGVEPPLTFGPTEMGRLKEIVLSGGGVAGKSGSYRNVEGLAERYLADLVSRRKLRHPLKAVAACGNGTAGLFAPDALRAIGCEVVELDCELDHTFPNHNPNPEDLTMLQAVGDAVTAHDAAVGLAFDGDGDRCGIVDDRGEVLFADKVGVLLARDLSAVHPGARFVVDVKSTSLFATDPALIENGATVGYWKTGHSHMKRRLRETGALAGFEKSGHFFFNAPLGRGYDDGLLSAIAVCEMLDRNSPTPLSRLRTGLPTTWQSPTMSPSCADESKYEVVERTAAHFVARAAAGQTIAGERIRDIVTVNGIRIELADGTWCLVRASSNKPELVVVAESPTSEAAMKAIFAEIDAYLSAQPEVGEYNQKI